MVRVAMIGAGRVAEVHHDAIGQTDLVQLAGVYDVDDDVTKRRAADWGVRGYPDLAAVLADPDNDAVLVLTHVDSHLDVAARAIDAGKHVFIEKPVGRDPEVIRALADRARRAGLVAMPGHNYAHLPEFVRAKTLADAGHLGELRALFINYVIKHPEEIARDYSGVLEEVMIHHTYLALALLGAPERVVAGVTEPGWTEHREEDQAWLTFDYGRATAHAFATFAVDDLSNAPWSFVLKLLGTKGSAVVDFRTAVFERALGTLSVALVPYEESYRNELVAFADAIAGRPEPIVSTLADAATSAGLIEACRLSIEQAGFVRRVDGSRRRW